MTPLYNVVLSKLAESKFDKLIHSDRKLGEQVAKAIDRIASNPDLGELLRGEWKGHRNIGRPLSNHLPHRTWEAHPLYCYD
jgi:hypothetical protein